MSLRVTVVANSVARKNVEPIISMIRNAAPKTAVLNIIRTPGPNTATEIARTHLDTTDLFIAIGGDGTVSEVAEGLNQAEIPIAIIPAGSTNIIAREQGIPTAPEDAVALAFGKHNVAALDLGYCNDTPFLHMAGMGVDAYMFEFSNRDLKRQIGWGAYFPAAGKALMQGSEMYRVTADGKQFECESPLILVANGRSVLSPRIELHPTISSSDGYLDLLIFQANTPLEILRTISRFMSRSLTESPYVTHIRMQSAEIETRNPVPVEVDGDVVTTTPVKFTVKPASVSIVVPTS